MKTLVKLIFLGVLTVLLSMAAMAKDPVTKHDPTPKEKSFFVLKADKKFIGARVEIVQPNGSVIAEQILQKKRMIIDFQDVKSGAYTIRLVKGNQKKEYQYKKS
jgi:hypothetical protein